MNTSTTTEATRAGTILNADFSPTEVVKAPKKVPSAPPPKVTPPPVKHVETAPAPQVDRRLDDCEQLVDEPRPNPVPGYTPPCPLAAPAVKDNETLSKEADLAFLKDFMLGDFDWLESHFGGWGGENDGKLSRQDINWAAADVNLRSSAREAAARFKSNPRLFNVIDADKDGNITRDEIAAYRKQLEAELALSAPTPTPGATATRGAAAATATNPVGDANSVTTIRSSLPGLEGAVENLGYAINSVQGQMTDLTNQLTGDAKADAKISGQISMLQTRLQMLLNAQSSLLTMMSNVAKMWSETQNNAIRNMK